MFDCIIVNFQNTDSSLTKLKQKFPNALVTSFVDSYHYLIKCYIGDIKTEYFWLLSTKINYDTFDFDFIPEQHEQHQIHTWSKHNQQEGDIFLIPKLFPKDLKFLRDFKDINYKKHYGNYDHDNEEVQYSLATAIENLPDTISNQAKYIKYYEQYNDIQIYPSYWEDLKIYKNQNTFFIPHKAKLDIRNQIYDYPLIDTVCETKTKDCFDIVFISNGEPFAQSNYDILVSHCKKNNLKNKLMWVKDVNGRTMAYKQAAKQSTTEYFYAVFAKTMVIDDFLFDYTVDRGLSKKHRIFYSYLKEVDLAYGTFNINLYNKTLCLQTADDSILDFTLSQAHEVVPIVASNTLLAPDNYTAWKNAFREVSKLVLWQHQKATVETSFRLKKWLAVEDQWLSKGALDGKSFTEECKYDLDKILQTYTWDFCRAKFKSLYPTETFY